MKNYHKTIFFPASVNKLFGKSYFLKYTSHAIDAMVNDRYGTIRPARSVKIDAGNLVEVTLNDFGNVVKCLVRLAHDAANDVCLVLMPDFEQAIVKTAWLCRKDDNHATLEAGYYSKE